MGWELDAVERPFVEQLVSMGWRYVEGDLDAAAATGRATFTEVIQETNGRSRRADGWRPTPCRGRCWCS
ncbi:MAG: hypothetical protein IV093_07290 [Rubrivivax sp.]|nr:hypothetical protein [Rubrivivax sp.]